MKNKMWRVFQHDVPGEFCLQCGSMRLELVDHDSAIRRAESTHKDVRALEIRGDINRVNADQRSLEIDFARYDTAELAFHQFVHP